MQITGNQYCGIFEKKMLRRRNCKNCQKSRNVPPNMNSINKGAANVAEELNKSNENNDTKN